MFKIAPEGFDTSMLDQWAEFYDAQERGKPIEAVVTRVRWDEDEGIWELEFPEKTGITGLVPFSESGLPNKALLNQFVGQKVTVKVMGINKNEQLVACSRQAVVNTALLYLINQLKEGEVAAAVVRAVSSNKVYLDIGGGVIIEVNSKKAWLSPAVPLNVQYEKGNVVKIRVIGIDKDNRQIEVEPLNPWEEWKFNRGEIVLGEVVITKNTLAFVKVKPGIIGLAPADGCIAGERTKFQVSSYNGSERKLRLKKWDSRKTLGRRIARKKNKK